MFYNTQTIHKQLIQQSYDDCIRIADKKSKLNKESKKYVELTEELEKCKNILIQNLLSYSKNYPNEVISQNKFIKEYNQYGWVLENNLSYVVGELYINNL